MRPTIPLPAGLRRTFALVLPLLMLSVAFGQKIEVMGQIYEFRGSSSSSTADLNEYTPAGQTLANWDSYVSVRKVYDIASAREYISNLAARYQQQFPNMPFASGEVEATGGYWLDYLAFAPETAPEDQRFLVWSFFMVEPRGQDAVLVLQYSRRVLYDKTIADGIEKLKLTENHDQWVKRLTSRPIKDVLAAPKEQPGEASPSK